jgi:hypothetical protein
VRTYGARNTKEWRRQNLCRLEENKQVHQEGKLHAAQFRRYFTETRWLDGVLKIGCVLSSFYQIPLHPDSSKLTTFIAPMGRFCFKRVPFGISSGAEIFQRKMTELLSDCEGVEVIMDDVLIHGETKENHDYRLKTVLEKIHAAGMKLNKEKCEFGKSQVTYFGNLISAEGVRPNPARVKAVYELKEPKDKNELRRIVGTVNYLGRFAPDLSSIMRPMTDLLKDDAAWTWGSSLGDHRGLGIIVAWGSSSLGDHRRF